ncbi:MAG TPA: CHAD domain-containing protein [Blastocatellia bacterium]|jgi:CHAD domain-containing protein
MAEAEQASAAQLKAASPEKRSRHLLEIIPSQLELLRSYHRDVLETDDVDAVHKMRVTTRRLQASLDLLERQMNVRKLKRRLRRWRRTLSRVRNYDVFLELIEKEAVGRRQAHREQFELVQALLQQRRLNNATRVRQFLEGINVNQISVALSLEPPSTKSESEAGFMLDGKVMSGWAADRLDQRLAEFQALVAQAQPTTDPAELHQVRIAAKRMRYLLEVISTMGYGDASRALAWLRTLQDRIGDWHDLEALEEEIIAIVSSREFMKAHLAESGRMLQAAAHLQKKKAALRSRLFPLRVPKSLETTSRRIARSLRRDAALHTEPE